MRSLKSQYDLFLTLLRRWCKDTEDTHYDHFGKYLLESMGFNQPFQKKAAKSSHLFFAVLTKQNGTKYYGLITSISFDGKSLAIAFKNRTSKTIKIPLTELSSMYEGEPEEYFTVVKITQPAAARKKPVAVN